MTDESKRVVVIGLIDIVLGLVAVSVSVRLAYVIIKYIANLLGSLNMILRHKPYPLQHQHMLVVSTVEEYQYAIDKLILNSKGFRVLGFDCEWVTINGSRQPIALLQLASKNGLCALIRLCKLKHIPISLRKLLEDSTVLKVGVAPIEDSQLLLQDYGVRVAGCLDLRHLTHSDHGLASLARSILGVELDKDWRLRCGNWEAETLVRRQLDYAAKDALVAVEIFARLVRPSIWGLARRLWQDSDDWRETLNLCLPHVDVGYKSKSGSTAESAKGNGVLQEASHPTEILKDYFTNLKQLNIYMEAPDREVLAMCDRRTAHWYLANGLGHVIGVDPPTILVKFEPAGMPVGEMGRYYTAEKSNRCVVCGQTNSYIWKNVVPYIYRKHLPLVMKDHDILLLCRECHQHSNDHDMLLRRLLAVLCHAPLESHEDVKRIGGSEIPLKRTEEMFKFLRLFFPAPTPAQQAQNIQPSVPSLYYDEPHGLQVVFYFSDGSGGAQVILETMWRQYFLQFMTPRFMPPSWSVHHNHEAGHLSIGEQGGAGR